MLFLYFRCLIEFMWLENRFLNASSVRPMYMLDLLVSFFGMTLALYSKSPHIRTYFFESQAEIGSHFKDTMTSIRVYRFLFEEWLV